MKIYKIARAIGYILYGNDVIKVTDTTHIDFVRNKFDLEDQLIAEFDYFFNRKFNWGNDDDCLWIDQKTMDFMDENDIFCVVVDYAPEKPQVYIRPNFNKRPDYKQMKILKDWAIENNFEERIIIDYVVANNKIKIYRIASDIDSKFKNNLINFALT